MVGTNPITGELMAVPAAGTNFLTAEEIAYLQG
jgi:hypothetical protein